MPSPAVERELRRAGDTDLLARARRKEKPKGLDKPDEALIEETFRALEERFRPYREKAIEERKRRYQKDKLPERWQKELVDGRRFFSRLTHNEINRVVGQQTDNPPRFVIAADGDKDADKEKGQKQTRWLNNLLAALERNGKGRRNSSLRRRLVDIQNEIGMAGLEVYLTKSYDDVDAQERPDEKPEETLARVDKQLRNRRLPFGVRVIDGVNLMYDEDDDDVSVALIVEMKPFHALKRKYGKTSVGDAPKAGAIGYAMNLAGGEATAGVDLVPTIRYYDERWYAYMVNGVIVECEEHGMPGVPVFPVFGLVTGSSNFEEGVEGICWGMGGMEHAANDLMTLMLDVMWKNRQPKYVVETEVQGRFIPDPTNPNEPKVLDLSNLEAVQQLYPGQHLINAHKDWQPFIQLQALDQVMAMWGKSAQNPIAQGQSPGADPAGYTVATLSDNAMTVFKDIIGNEARAWAALGDFIRLVIRDTIKLQVPLTVPMGRQKARATGSQVEWLSLGPDDITEVPTICTIDPNSDAHRLANRQSWMEGNQAGYVPRHVVQTRAFGAEDPDEWDDDIVVDGMRERVAQLAVEGALQEVQLLQAPPPAPPPGGGSGLVGPDGVTPISSSGPGVPSRGPAPTPPPTVGAAANTASREFAGAARAGEDSGYVPRVARQ